MTETVAKRPLRPCPICKKLSAQKYHPFCSDRCAQIDLGRWLGGNYAVPAEDAQDQPETGESE
jgi:uncharacterized protein